MKSSWDPALYERFEEQRAQPFADLVALLDLDALEAPSLVDLGCGTGSLTARLASLVSARLVVGVDSADTMLARAARDHGDLGELVLADLTTWAPGRTFDLVFSHACLQWLHGHAELIPRVSSWVAPEGQLAIQMPANHDYPTHVLAASLATEEPFVGQLSGYRRISPVLKPNEYATILYRQGFVEQKVVSVVYPHVLPSRDAVLEWVSGTLLKAYESRMTAADFRAFFGVYRERLFAELPDERPFFYPFKRVMLWARR